MPYKCLTCSGNSIFLWRHAKDSLINVFRTRICGQTLLFIVIANCAIVNNYTLHNTSLVAVDTAKYLGLNISSKLSWSNLVDCVYINDLVECCGEYADIYVFVDDAKFFRHILQPQDQDMLQHALNLLHSWSQKWLLNLNINKCQLMSFGRHTDNTCIYNVLDHNNCMIPLAYGRMVRWTIIL